MVQQRPADLPAILKGLNSSWLDHPFARYLQAQYWLITRELQAVQAAGSGLWSGEDQEPLLALAHAAWLLSSGAIPQADAFLAQSHLIPDCPERVRLQSRVYQAQGQLDAALACLQAAADRAPQLLELQHHLCELLLEANRPARLLPRLRQVMQRHGEARQILAPVATAKLLQRQPGLARRAALLHRLKGACTTDQSATTNQLICYEQTGHSDWLEHLTPGLLGDQPDPNLLANLVMQLASVESPLAASAAGRFCALMQQRNQQMGITPFEPQRSSSRPKGQLRIAWLSGDVCDHPVGRFLLGFFHACQAGLRHRHTLVSWADDNPFHEWFAQLNHLELLEVRGLPAAQLVQKVRSLQADVVIDLGGWTAKNFGNGFLARLAPLQINYLGYFASTGNPEMDCWLGDARLFPEPMGEWHTETIYRLPRCFLAWQPAPQLPESGVPVPPAPTGFIRFGSFNHNRKFSDRALRLWGQILAAIPGSSLVLKATAPGDEATLELLQRRMHRCGLDPVRVIWLPLVAANRDHLLQYGQIDVALDCLPNGGCTTTCEALWMGVPVITLTGSTYVSRMSTAVLHGAGLSDWCAVDEQQYVQLAITQAQRLDQLRTQRSSWRQRLITSPLGDAADLMRHLEHAFTEMHQRRCAKHASSL
jgi:predicted O-linked N-acetylglucosamine transferase (SPINDLY family)